MGLTFGALLAGCVDPDPYRGPAYDPSDPIAELVIDAGGRVEPEPGEGVGISVEYAGEGQWSLYTTCDTSLSDASCLFDVLVFADDSESGITDVQSDDLEAEDDTHQPDDFALALDLVTGADLDGVGFATDPGATVRVSALLYDPIEGSRNDWSEDPRLISWVGNGALHWGAPTNPVDLRPDRP